jgi:hypothetical protein
VGQDIEEVKQRLKLLLEEYKKAMKQFGTRLGPLSESEDISDLIDWLLKVFQDLPNVISGASDFATLFQWKAFSSFFMTLTVLTFQSSVEGFHDSWMQLAPQLSVPTKMFVIRRLNLLKNFGLQARKSLRKILLVTSLRRLHFLNFVELLAFYRHLFS